MLARFASLAIVVAAAAWDATVRLLRLFHVSDEPQLERLQTGVCYSDDTPKSSLKPVAEAAAKARNGDFACS